MTGLHFDREAIKAVDLSALADKVAWHPNSQYFDLPPGTEHYKLLAHVAAQVQDGLILDIGTYLGFSALALATNPTNRVVSFDLVDCKLPSVPPNVELVVGDITTGAWDDLIARASLVMLDVDPHDGVQETAIVAHLRKAGFRGHLLCDDIHLNAGMRAFWASLPEPKQDLSGVGHITGTGYASYA